MNPMFGAAAMSLSSFCVVTNALRLNLVKIYDTARDEAYKKKAARKGLIVKTTDNTDNSPVNNITSQDINNKRKEDNKMTKTMNIEGMMCGHCEARVKKALESVDGVSGAVVSHEKNEAVVTLAKEVDDEVLKKAVEEQDYKVVAIN
jgi:Cu2+-exporting ATPase